MNELFEKQIIAERLQRPWQATLCARAGFKCEYCELDFLTEENWFRLQWDHITPRKRGGGNDLDNLACACSACNSYKGELDPRTRVNKPNPTREELISAAQTYIAEQKAFGIRRMHRIKEIIHSALATSASP